MQDQANSVREYLDKFIDQIVDALPEFIGAILILVIGYFVAKFTARATRQLLGSMRLDERLHTGKGGNVIQRAVPNPAQFASKLMFWIIFFVAISLAVYVMGIPALVDFVKAVYAYIPNVIAAIAIFLVAGAISAGIATLVSNTMGETPTGKVVASAGPALVMGLAVFMILNQLKIAPEIVSITYTALIGSVALGMALAFGFGGKDIAARLLQDLYDNSQKNKEIVSEDLQHGAQQAKRKTNTIGTSSTNL